MNHILPSVLALDVGARQIGAAVFEKQKLVFYAVKTIKKTTHAATLKQTRKVFKGLVLTYNIQIIALEKLAYPQQQKSFVQTVYKEIKKNAQRMKVEILEFEPLFIRQTVSKTEVATKHNTFKVITRLYPELSKFLFLKKNWHETYYAYLFNAIAVGLVSIKEIKRRIPFENNTENERS